MALACVSVMNVLCKGNKLNFKPSLLEDKNLRPPPPASLHYLCAGVVGLPSWLHESQAALCACFNPHVVRHFCS